MNNDIIKEFTDQLIKEAGFDDMDSAKRAEYQDNLLGLVQKKLGIEMMKMMSDDDIDAYVEFIQTKPNEEQLYEFFNTKVTGLDEKIVTMLQQFKKEFLTNLETYNELSA